MDEIELIQRVLCRLNLPDADVYTALARVRDARRRADSDQIASEFRRLLKTFLAAVRQGLQSPTAELDPWVLLSRRPELRDDPEIQEFLRYMTRLRRATIPVDWFRSRPDPDDDEGGARVPAPRTPRGPKPSLKNKKEPPPGM